MLGKMKGYWQEPYPMMVMKDFSILRPPTTKRYRKALARLKEIEQQEIDKRWNLWHHYFKRIFFYRRFLRPIVRFLKWRGVL